MMADNTAEQIFKPRQELISLFKEYDFFRRSYEGGSAYRDGKFLIRHPRENDDDYERRLEQASYVNFCSDVCDIYTAYLYREQPERKFKNKDAVIEAFMVDADLEGRAWPKVMRGLSNMASYFGLMGIIVDKPTGKIGVSRAAELEAGIRPYVAAYTPLSIWDWKFSKDANGIRFLSELILEEDNDGGPQQVMRWTIFNWELWELKSGSDNKFVKVGGEDHSLAEIPFALLRNRDSFKKMSGVSDIADIAPVNRRIYYLDSDALEIIDSTAFPILEGSAAAIEDTSGKDQETVIGNASLLKRPEGGEAEGFRWIEAPHTSLAQILAHRNSSISDIKYMSKTGQTEAEKGQPASGVSLELTFQQLNALLADKAENAETFEDRIFRLVDLWEGVDHGAEIKYTRKFGIRDMMHDLDVALTSKAVINSPTYAAELGKNFAFKILPRDTDAKIIKQIEDELDNPVPPPGSEEDGTDEDGDDG
jgi:hypothetical protein